MSEQEKDKIEEARAIALMVTDVITTAIDYFKANDGMSLVQARERLREAVERGAVAITKESIK
jgi:hypothetical protein